MPSLEELTKQQTQVGAQEKAPSLNDLVDVANRSQPEKVMKQPEDEGPGFFKSMFSETFGLGESFATGYAQKQYSESMQQRNDLVQKIEDRVKAGTMSGEEANTLMKTTIGGKPPERPEVLQKSTMQNIGEMAGTALWLTPVNEIKMLKGASILNRTARGTVLGGSFATAHGMAEGMDKEDIAKHFAFGAIGGAGLEVFGPAVFKGMGKTLLGASKAPFKLVSKVTPQIAKDYISGATQRMVYPIETRLKTLGPFGEEIANRLMASDRKFLERAGTALNKMERAGLQDLNDMESLAVLDALEGRASRESLSSKTAKVYDELDRLRTEIASDAKNKGVQVQLKRGEEGRPFTKTTKGVDTLAQEARKYDSAKEFLEAQKNYIGKTANNFKSQKAEVFLDKEKKIPIDFDAKLTDDFSLFFFGDYLNFKKRFIKNNQKKIKQLKKDYVKQTKDYAGARDMDYEGIAKLAKGDVRKKAEKLEEEFRQFNMRMDNISSGRRPVHLKNVLDYDNLYKAYPSAKNIKVYFRTKLPKAKGNFFIDENGFPSIGISPEYSKAEVKDILRHEIQHYIQAKEGWYEGGSLDTLSYSRQAQYYILKEMKNKLLNNKKYSKVTTIEDIQYIDNKIKELAGGKKLNEEEFHNIFGSGEELDKLSRNVYERLYGEMEANSNFVGNPLFIRDAFKNYKQIYNQAVKKAPKKKTPKKSGKVPFVPRKNYFPHLMPQIKNLKQGKKMREVVVSNSVRTGRFKTKEDAEMALDSFIDFVETGSRRDGEYWLNHLIKTGQARNKDEAMGMTTRFFKPSRNARYGQLEKARELDFPFYDPDVRRVFPQYFIGASQRLRKIADFGPGGEELSKLFGKLERERIKAIGGTEARESAKEARRLVDRALGVIDESEGRKKISLLLRSLQIPKLAFAQILNIGQNMNTLLATDLPSLAYGMQKAFRQEGVERAFKSGATMESILRESSMRGDDFRLTQGILKATGFTWTEKFNRTVAANAGVNFANKMRRRLLKNPEDKVAKDILQEMGVRTTNLGKDFTESELNQIAQKTSFLTQFRSRPLDMPAWTSSPEGKVLFQFKNFAYNQTRFVKRMTYDEIKKGNIGRGIRGLTILGTVFPMTGEVIADIRSLMTGSTRPTKFLDRYIENAMNVGAIGIWGDMVRSLEWEDLKGFATGPTADTFSEIAERMWRIGTTGEILDSDKKFFIRQPGITRPLANYMFPSKSSEREQILELFK